MNSATILKNAVQKNGPCAFVRVLNTKGSTPRGTDAWMVVTPQGFHGSVGGGTLEWKAMAEAQALLQKGEKRRLLDFVLGPDLGQCCGGRMQIEIEVYDEKSVLLMNEVNEKARQIYLFGAGHVARALVLALAPLPFEVLWIDQRPNAFPAVTPANVTMIKPENPLSVVADVAAGALVFVMTHSHALDLAIIDAALRNPNFEYVGLIGSATKRARFENRLSEATVDAARIAALICPIGVGGITSKHPAAIAAAVAAQILQLDSQLSARAHESDENKATGTFDT
jgi:xanthine dehydrogenase accessory factor